MPLPLLWGCAVTALHTLLFVALQRHSVRIPVLVVHSSDSERAQHGLSPA
jgi:hypothetical protein